MDQEARKVIRAFREAPTIEHGQAVAILMRKQFENPDVNIKSSYFTHIYKDDVVFVYIGQDRMLSVSHLSTGIIFVYTDPWGPCSEPHVRARLYENKDGGTGQVNYPSGMCDACRLEMSF